MRTKVIRCPACKKRVRDHQPDVVITDVSTGRQHVYHTAMTCMEEAFAAAFAPGKVYHFAVRTPDGSMN